MAENSNFFSRTSTTTWILIVCIINFVLLLGVICCLMRMNHRGMRGGDFMMMNHKGTKMMQYKNMRGSNQYPPMMNPDAPVSSDAQGAAEPATTGTAE